MPPVSQGSYGFAFIGPPAPPLLRWLARGSALLVLALVGHWVSAYLGGVAMAPHASADGRSNDTNGIFNWHPILMTLGFVVFMTEALLAYKAPWSDASTRAARKTSHWAFHSLAALCVLFGLIAVFNSHNLKRPEPMPNLYSAHSCLGLFTVALAAFQFALGCAAYLWPKFSLATRVALGPIHRFLGLATWCLGLAAAATGLQEKTTFLQMGKKLAGDEVYGPAMRLPALALLMLAVTALLVLYHHAPPAAPPADKEPLEPGMARHESDAIEYQTI
jgi:cytochrome b-561